MCDALHDSYLGIDFDLPAPNGEGTVAVTVPALRFAEAMRLMALAERVQAGDSRAAVAIVREICRVVGPGSERFAPQDAIALFGRLFDPSQYALEGPKSEGEEQKKSEIAYTFTDLVADYAAAYGGPPRADDPWPLVLALVQRSPRFEHRARLQLLDSVAAGIGAALSDAPEIALGRDELFRGAYPVTRKTPAFALIQSENVQP